MILFNQHTLHYPKPSLRGGKADEAIQPIHILDCRDRFAVSQ